MRNTLREIAEDPIEQACVRFAKRLLADEIRDAADRRVERRERRWHIRRYVVKMGDVVALATGIAVAEQKEQLAALVDANPTLCKQAEAA